MSRRPNRPSSRPRPKSLPRKFPPSPARPRPAPPVAPGGEAKGGRSPQAREALHVAPLEVLAESAVAIAMTVEQAVMEDGKRADRAIAWALRMRRDLAVPDHRFISQAV